jgi:hypothetical protein
VIVQDIPSFIEQQILIFAIQILKFVTLIARIEHQHYKQAELPPRLAVALLMNITRNETKTLQKIQRVSCARLPGGQFLSAWVYSTQLATWIFLTKKK